MISVPRGLPSTRCRAFVAASLVAFFSQPAQSQEASDDRLFTAAQAAEGARVYAASCAACHGGHLEGGSAPSLVGSPFLTQWGQPDRSLDDLFFVIRTIMPLGRARTLSAEQHASVFAYILKQNGYAAGDTALTGGDARLRDLTLRAQAGAPVEAPQRPDYFVGDSCTIPSTSGPGNEELEGASDNVRDWLYATHDYTGRRYVARSTRSTAGTHAGSASRVPTSWARSRTSRRVPSSTAA